MPKKCSLELSIIIPVLNGGKTLARAPNSVLVQKNCDYEVLIIDGGSKDNTKELALSVSSTDSRFRFIEVKGLNQSQAMNLGVKSAKGEYLGFLNCDDYYSPDAFSQALKILNENQCEMVVSGLRIWGDIMERKDFYEKLKYFEVLFLKKAAPANPTCYFYKRSLHKKVGFYDESDDFTMDFSFLLNVYSVITPCYSNAVWGNFYYGQGTKSFSDREFSRWRRKICVVKHLGRRIFTGLDRLGSL